MPQTWVVRPSGWQQVPPPAVSEVLVSGIGYLHVHRGTKGGRRRYVPIDTPERQRAVDIARLIAKDENESVSDPRLTLTQAIRHLRYVLECCGMTKADLKVTPHGFRHQYAADEYERVTGVRPPVEGGVAPDKAIDAAARQDVSMKLGHGRPDISNAYLGCREDAAPDGSAAVGCPAGAEAHGGESCTLAT